MTDTLTDTEIDEEKKYRVQERIGILIDGADREPTPEEINLAFKESREWESTYREQNTELRHGAKTHVI